MAEPSFNASGIDLATESRVDVESSLIESDQRFHEIFSAIDAVIWMRDPHRHSFIYVSPAYARIWGRSLVSLYADPASFLDAVHPDDRLRVIAALPLQTLGSYDIEYRVLRPDGSISWVHDVAFPVRDAYGVVVRVAGIAADITARLEAEGRLCELNLQLETRIVARTIELSEKIEALESAQQALNQSEDKYRLVIENVSEGVVLVQNKRFVFANPRACEISGYSAEDLRNIEFPEVVHPDDREKVIDRHRRRLAGEDVEARYDFRTLHRDGKSTWIELGAVLIQWEGQVATLCFFSDISARKRLEENLRQTLVERETILENSLVGIVFLNPKGRVRWVNEGLRAMIGGQVADLIGTSLEPFYASREEYLRIGEQVAAAVCAGQSYETELQLRRPDGGLLWVYLSGKAVNVFDLSLGTVWVVVDISARKQLEIDLQRTSSEREAILQSTLVGITFSIDRKHQWVNRTLAEMLGYTPDELIGQSSMIHCANEKDWLDLGARAYPALARGEHYSTECQMRHHDGHLLWIELSGCCVDPQDFDKGSIFTYLDISERKRAEADVQTALVQQKELNQMKSRFVSMTSHEFRTPLSTILSSTELLRHYSDRIGAEERDELFDSIETGVMRMTEMLDNMLIIGQADAGRLRCSPAALDLDRFCCDMAVEAEAAAEPSGVRPELRLDIESGGVPVEMDEKLLRHIVGNLLSNALKYSPNGGAVNFSLRIKDSVAIFVVADQGIGIPAEELPKLFASFHRATNVGNIPGTGLGLAIVIRSVEVHGGRIRVESELGRGARFTVELPVNGLPLEGCAIDLLGHDSCASCEWLVAGCLRQFE
jgi:PAS domain S-box-containing protein